MGQKVYQNTPSTTTYGRDSNGNPYAQGKLESLNSSTTKTTLNGSNPSTVQVNTPGVTSLQGQPVVVNAVPQVNVDQQGNYQTNSSTEVKQNPNAPQRVLEENPYRPALYRYPLDLETNKKKGHLVRFNIYETEASPLLKFQSTTSVGLYNEATTKIERLVKKLEENVKTGRLENSNLRKSSKTAVELYIPDNLNFSYTASYDDISVTNSLIRMLSGVGTKKISLGSVVGSIVTSDVGRLASQSLGGVALNPQQQLLFQGTNFRSFQMAFAFTPRSQKEADEITKIVKTFKKHALPTIVENTAGFIYRPPSTFEIIFFSNGYENTKINRVATSVLENVDVSYTPNGWTTHSDGNPVQTILSLSFKETIVLDSKKIDEGY